MKITYDEQGKMVEIIFAEGEDQKAFWDAYKAREKEITERCINRDNAYKEMCIANDKEITERNKYFINSQIGYMGYNELSNINSN